jgi:hypothetical protein
MVYRDAAEQLQNARESLNDGNSPEAATHLKNSCEMVQEAKKKMDFMKDVSHYVERYEKFDEEVKSGSADESKLEGLLDEMEGLMRQYRESRARNDEDYEYEPS